MAKLERALRIFAGWVIHLSIAFLMVMMALEWWNRHD
jgi:hypothetical protein